MDPDDKTDAKKHTKQERILIIVGIAGLVLTVLLLRNSASNSSSGTSSQEEADEQDIAQLQQELQSMQAQVAAEVPYGTSGSTTAQAPTPVSITVQTSGSGESTSSAPTTGLKTSGATLPDLNPSSFAQKLAAGSPLVDVIGSITGKSQYTGYNVSGNAPEYAYLGGEWQQGFNWATLPQGTKIATLKELSPYVASKQYTEHV